MSFGSYDLSYFNLIQNWLSGNKKRNQKLLLNEAKKNQIQLDKQLDKKTNKEKLMFGVPIKQWQTATKNERQLYKRLSNNQSNATKLRLNTASNINPSKEDIKAGKIKSAFFTNISDEDWNYQKELLKINHQEWLRKRGRIK